jgi:prepilin-type N-terminal cleavage/methylation domain-containing protein
MARRANRAVRDQRGMTLAEILIAVAIIGIGLTALLATVPLSGYGIQEGKQLSTATFLANARLDQVKNASWSSTPALDNMGVSASASAAPQSGGVTTFPDESPMAAPYTQYSRTVRIFGCDAAGVSCGVADANLRYVTITVTYRPLTGVGQSPTTKSAIVTMLIAQR